MLGLAGCFRSLTFGLLAGMLLLASPAYGAVHALLIGVSDYRESNIPDLGGPPNDVALIKDVLTRRFDIPVDNITTLLNPSHSAIERAFVGLAARVQRDDHVYIHYSGHGSWATAPAPRPGEEAERRGQDQTWVAYGSRSSRRQGKDAMDVLDKELALWLEPIYRMTPNLVFVSDSCHSASVTRDDQRGVRSADGSAQVHPLSVTIRHVAAPTSGLRIGAARDFESAVELDPRINGRCSDKTNCYGVFTWHWAAALQSSRPGESWGDVFSRATAAIAGTPGVMQRPQKEGVAERAVFDGRFAELSALVPVAELRPGGVVVLGAGLLSGLTVGSELESYKVTSDDPARLQVTSTSAGNAQAKLLNGTVKVGELVREVRHQYVDKPIRLFVGGMDAADAELANLVRRSVDEARTSALKGFDVVPRREDADLRLEILRPAAGTQAVAGARPVAAGCKSASCAPAEVWVLSPQGQLIDARMHFSMANQTQEMPRLLSNLVMLGHAREVRAVGAQGNATPLQLRVTVLRPPEGNTASCPEGVKEGSGWQRSAPVPLNGLNSRDLQLRDCLAVTLDNRDAAKTWYGYVLVVDPGFKVEAVWPPSGSMEDEARIEPRASYAVVSSLYRLSDPGRETLLFVVSEAPVPMFGLLQAGLKSAATRGTSNPLARLLSAGALTRGTETAIGTWGAQSLDLEVPAANQ